MKTQKHVNFSIAERKYVILLVILSYDLHKFADATFGITEKLIYITSSVLVR